MKRHASERLAVVGLGIDLAYSLAIGLSSPFLAYKALTRPRHVQGLRARLGLDLPEPVGRPCVWVHGVSVGEILAAKTFIAALDQAFPGYEIVLSTTTSTGQEIAAKRYPERRLHYFPIDFSRSVRRIMERIDPALIVLVELELWPNFLEAAEHRGVPVAIVNGRISERSARRYGKAPALVRRMFQRVRSYCLQTDAYAARFEQLGVPRSRIAVTGSMKYDNLAAPSEVDVKALRKRLGIASGVPLIIAGSTHDPEEEFLLDAYCELRRDHPELRLILVPRHNERAPALVRDIENRGLTCRLFSELDGNQAEDEQAVILVDVMGELGRLYAIADICFVGGSLIPHGGQNILEPAAYGKPVVIGPHCFNFQESVKDFRAADALLEVKNPKALRGELDKLLRSPERCAELGARALSTVESGRGATDKTIRALSALLPHGNGAETPAKESCAT